MPPVVDLSPAERIAALRKLQAHLPAIGALAGTAQADWLGQFLEAAARTQDVPLHFRAVGFNRWAIHRDDEPKRVLLCDLVGVRCAWSAIDAGAQGVPIDAFARDGARDAARMLRKALRITAATWFERVGSADLASAVNRITLTRDGRAIYVAPHTAQRIVTR